jgi:hypothetical protein
MLWLDAPRNVTVPDPHVSSSVSNPGDIIVYVEGSRYGPPESLRQIDPLNVASMRWLTDDQATTRYGTGHDNGVILVRLRGSQ